ITNTTLLQSDTTYLQATTCDANQVGIDTIIYATNGCDSLVITNTTLLPNATTTIDTTICFGGTYQVAGNTYNTAGTYVDTLIGGAANSCDSVITTNLTIAPVMITNLTATTCDVNQTGLDTVVITQNGCTNWEITETILLPIDTVIITQTSCNPADTGTVVQLLPNVNGCDTVMVTMTSLLPPPFVGITADTSICYGETIQLNAFGGIAYSWSPSNLLNNGNIPNPIATLTDTTIFSVIVTGINGCTDTGFVTVNVYPEIIISIPSPPSICVGDSTNLLAAATGGTGFLYTWTPGSTLTDSTINNPIAFPTVTTDYNINVTNSFGCSADTTLSVNVQLPPILTVSNDTAICYGDNAFLNASSNGSLTWDDGSTMTNRVVSPLMTTTYDVTAQSSIGCAVSESVMVTVHDSIMPEIVYDTMSCTLIAYPRPNTGGVNYLWYYSPMNNINTAISSFLIRDSTGFPIQTSTFTVNSTYGTGYYIARVSTPDGCSYDSNPIYIEIDTNNCLTWTIKRQTTLKQLQLIPNPTRDYVDIHLVSDEVGKISTDLFSIEGRLLKQEIFDINQGENINRLDVDNLPQGVYLIRISKGIESQVMKLIILD
ncbi:MAG: T9SS type A sorting domain-containing protein, partial [Saprospiraceae bacterium]